MTILRHSLLPALTLTLAACAGGRTYNSEPPPRPLGAEIHAAAARETPTTPAAQPAEPSGVLTIGDALAAALMGNPALAEASWEVRASEARALQASLPSNPEIEIEAEEFGGESERSGFDGAEFSVGLSQEILTAGKLGLRTEVGRLVSLLRGWDYEARRLDVLTETVEAFVSVLAAQERVRILSESVQLASEVVRAVQEQVTAGKVPRLESSRAGVAHTLQQVQLDQARGELRSLRRALAASWGGTRPAFSSVRGALASLRPVPGREQLEAYLSENPAMARIAVERELHRARVELAESGVWPDVTLSAGATRFNETDDLAFAAGIAITIPLFDAGKAGVREARAEAASASARLRGAAAKLSIDLLDAYEELELAAAVAKTLSEQVLPAAETAFAAADDGFREGKFSYLEVLDAQRTLFQTKEQHVTALAAYHKSVARVERLIGRSLGSVRTEEQETR